MRVAQEPGFVLHGRDYSETSLILEVFTARHGRLGLLAKGARRRSSPWRGLLKPFQPLALSWTGRGELALLIGAEPAGGEAGFDVETLYCGFYLNELLMRLLHRHDPHETLFDAYRSALAALAGAALPEVVLRIFEKRLLAEIGYGLVLDRDIADNSALAPQALYDYVLERGPVCVGEAGRGRPTRGVRVHGASLLALAREQLDTPLARRETKRLMRAALSRHLDGRPLHSRRLYQRVLALRARANERSEQR
jgi:DNA repair protein RecO (recombination protein O)